MLKQILITFGTILGTLAPIISTIACEKKEKINIREDKFYFLDLYIQASNSRQKFEMDEFINKADLSKLPSNFNGFYKSKMLVGGFGEPRSFYSGTLKTKNPRSFYHLGYDVIVSQGSRIYAPTTGEILAAWWKSPTKTIIAEGVGGEILMRIKIADLKVKSELKEMIYVKKMRIKWRSKELIIDWVARAPKLLFAKNGEYNKIISGADMELATKQEYDDYLNSNKQGMLYKNIANEASNYIYIFFMHLSKNTPNLLDNDTRQTKYKYKTKTKDITYHLRMAPNIDIDNPLKVKQWKLIGYVGDATDNGGWPHHVHIETYVFFPIRSNRIARVYGKNQVGGYRIKNKPITSKDFRVYRNAKAVGTYDKKSVKRSKKTFRNWYISRLQAIDANEIFDLYDKKTPIKKVII